MLCLMLRFRVQTFTPGRLVVPVNGLLTQGRRELRISLFPVLSSVGHAFGNGFTFEELSELIGAACRVVQFDVPTFDFECLRQINGFEDFNLVCETFTMLTPICGLKDAPRAWRRTLHQAFEQ